MLDMQRIQPKLKAILDKYKDDKEKLQQEMMKLYQEHKLIHSADACRCSCRCRSWWRLLSVVVIMLR